MSKIANFTISKMYCCNCGKEGLPICRKKSHSREDGHLKKLYCVYCGKLWNHAEIKPSSDNYTLEDFKLEMQYENFDNEGNRKEPFNTFKRHLKQKEII